MDFLSLAELGAQVVLDVILLWLVIKYLPKRDEQFTREIRNLTGQINRLVSAVILTMDDDDKKRHQLSDDILKQEEQEQFRQRSGSEDT